MILILRWLASSSLSWLEPAYEVAECRATKVARFLLAVGRWQFGDWRWQLVTRRRRSDAAVARVFIVVVAAARAAFHVAYHIHVIWRRN